MAPHYEKLAGVYAGDDDVVIAHLDATEYGDFGDRFDVQGYPTVKFFGKDKKTEPQEFNGREIEDMVTIVNEFTGKFRTADGGLTTQAGRIEALDAIVEAATAIDEDVVTKLTTAGAGMEGADKKNSAVYVAAAKKIIAKGAEYAAKEINRVTGIIDGDSVTAAKKTAFMIKRNVLAVFVK